MGGVSGEATPCELREDSLLARPRVRLRVERFRRNKLRRVWTVNERLASYVGDVLARFLGRDLSVFRDALVRG